ncbi:hypothetical protein VIGAN_05173400, partial [Vigna angularis var. angularis]
RTSPWSHPQRNTAPCGTFWFVYSPSPFSSSPRDSPSSSPSAAGPANLPISASSPKTSLCPPPPPPLTPEIRLPARTGAVPSSTTPPFSRTSLQTASSPRTPAPSASTRPRARTSSL